MNKENLRKLRSILKRVPDEHFNMISWASGFQPGDVLGVTQAPCGTTACMAGWAVVAEFGPIKIIPDSGQFKSPGTNRIRQIEANARRWLELTDRQASRLFFKTNWPTRFMTMGDKEGALAILDGLISGKLVFGKRNGLVEAS